MLEVRLLLLNLSSLARICMPMFLVVFDSNLLLKLLVLANSASQVIATCLHAELAAPVLEVRLLLLKLSSLDFVCPCS